MNRELASKAHARVMRMRVESYSGECLDDTRIELRSSLHLKASQRLRGREAISIRSIRRHCIKRVRDGNHTREKRDIVGSDPIGIPTTVVAFVMVPYNRGYTTIVLDIRENTFADCRRFPCRDRVSLELEGNPELCYAALACRARSARFLSWGSRMAFLRRIERGVTSTSSSSAI